MRDIFIITTGGTIDSHYDPEKGVPYVVPQHGGSVVPSALKELGVADRCDVYQLCVKDSKKISTTDLECMIDQMAKPYDQIIITHGTDQMAINARRLRDLMQRHHIEGKRVVFTGAMEPLRDDQMKIRPTSDGWENVRVAVEQVGKQPPGVYLAVNGKMYGADDLDKRVVVDKDGKVIESGFVERTQRATERGTDVVKR